MIFEFPKSKYTLEESFDVLEMVYSDRQVNFMNEDNTYYYFNLSIPNKTSWYIDPLIKEDFESLPYWYDLSCNNEKIFFITHFHSNALIARECFSIIHNNPIKFIIHYDDHMDMMPIYLPKEELSHYNKKQLIEKSIVCIGNFLTYHFLENKDINFQVIHVKRNTERYTSTFCLKKNSQKIGSTIFEKNEVIFGCGNNTYTACKSEFLPSNLNASVWLDIDLDYFYNKFNRNSDWVNNTDFQNYSAKELKQLFNNELQKIISKEWFNNVKLLTIATSPGFFPFEFLNIAHSNFIQPLYKEYMKNEHTKY